jgi:hypothetical protein
MSKAMGRSAFLADPDGNRWLRARRQVVVGSVRYDDEQMAARAWRC